MTDFTARLKKSTGKSLPVLIFIIILILALYSYLSDTGNRSAGLQAGTAEIHFIDVGQGDSTLILSQNGSILIDAGPGSAEKELKKHLDKLGIKEIEYAVFTHPHEDHIGGADMIFDNYDVKNVILPSAVSTTLAYEKMLDGIEKSGATVHEAHSGGEYGIGDLHFTILAPNYTKYNGLNDYSVVLRLTYGNTFFMMTGDAEALTETEILESYPSSALYSDVLKVGHHGSNSSSTGAFLSAVSPSVAVISCGEGNTYGHPHSEIVSRLKSIGSTVLQTDKSGTIILRTDGNEIRLISK